MIGFSGESALRRLSFVSLLALLSSAAASSCASGPAFSADGSGKGGTETANGGAGNAEPTGGGEAGAPATGGTSAGRGGTSTGGTSAGDTSAAGDTTIGVGGAIIEPQGGAAGSPPVECVASKPLLSPDTQVRSCQAGSCYCSVESCYPQATAEACCERPPLCGDNGTPGAANCAGKHPIIGPPRTCEPGYCLCSKAMTIDVCLPADMAPYCCPAGIPLQCVPIK